MRIGIAATPDVALPTLDWLLESPHDLICVFTKPDRPAGRGRQIKPGIVAQWAQEHSVSLHQPANAQELAPLIRGLDLVITIGYGEILPKEVLEIPRFGFLNLHFSLLPAWRGAAPVQRSLLHGDTRTGITVFRLDPGMDTGPVYIQRDYHISPRANAADVLRDLAFLGPEAMNAAICAIAAGDMPTPQSSSGVTKAPKISKEEARIDWNRSSIEIDRQIRAFTPEPGAWTQLRDNAVGISLAQPDSSHERIQRGGISLVSNRVLVGCSDGSALELLDVKPSGRNLMKARDWFNGARLIDGDRFV